MGISALFLQKIKLFIRQGEGFLRNVPIPILSVSLASSGAPLTTTTSTNPGPALVDTNVLALHWDAATVVAAGIKFDVPDDYDSAKDHLKIRMKGKMAGSTNVTTGIDALVYKNTSTTDLNPTKSAYLTATDSWVEINLSGKSLVAGDVVQVNIFPEAHGTDAINLKSLKWEYRSTLVYADHNGSR
jgi:hypothetical protein